MRVQAVVAAVVLTATSAFAQTDSEIRKILTDRIDTGHQGIGMVVGIIGPGGRRVIEYGKFAPDSQKPVTGDTVFEIGSATKVFTSLLLADMVQRGEVQLSDPVAKYLPAGVKVPERGGRVITLLDLATQTSGLPRLPSNLAPKDPGNPYADYTEDQLFQFLSSYQLTRDIGSQYEYSNLGVGLLGQALVRRAGMSFEALVRTRITEPLGMKSTGVSLSPEMRERLAPGHDTQLKAAPNWDLPTLAGAGALRSTANDLLTFLAAELGYTKTPLAGAMASMPSVRRPTGTAGLEIALAWHIFTGDDEIVWHNGGTGGYRSFMGYAAKSRIGVVVLSNTFTLAGVDDIGFHLLDSHRPLITLRKEVPMDPGRLDGLVGRYQLAPSFILTVTREGNRLFTQATGQPRFEVFSKGNGVFFPKEIDAELSFETDANGRATQLVLHQGGRDMPAKRMDESAAAAAGKSGDVHVDPTRLEGYTGVYELAPNFALAVTHDADHLFVQATGQEKAEVFARTQTEFYLKVVDAQITFETDASGRATALVLHQNGADLPGKRLK